MSESTLPRNLRDLQRLAAILVSTRREGPWPISLQRKALEEWRIVGANALGAFGNGSRKERINWFRKRLAHWAKERWGTWEAAAVELNCDESTLRTDQKGD